MRFRTVLSVACLALIAACRNERPATNEEQAYPVLTVTTSYVDITESYSATI